MSAPWNIAQAADLVDRSIQRIVLKSSDPENMYSKYFNFRTTDDYYDKDSSISGLGEADFVDENAVIMSDTPVQGLRNKIVALVKSNDMLETPVRSLVLA